MKLFTYILRVISAIIFIISVCNSHIIDISTYIIVTIISFTISIALWQYANALDESDNQQCTSEDCTDCISKQLQQSA